MLYTDLLMTELSFNTIPSSLKLLTAQQLLSLCLVKEWKLLENHNFNFISLFSNFWSQQVFTLKVIFCTPTNEVWGVNRSQVVGQMVRCSVAMPCLKSKTILQTNLVWIHSIMTELQPFFPLKICLLYNVSKM